MIPISETPPALRRLLLLLAVAGALLTATLVPGVFTIDEDNYLVNVLALRQGRLTVPGTEGLPASNELAWFDPVGEHRKIEETPVVSTAPPLYAPVALPFSFLGWRGLQFLNVLAYLAATFLVFAYARRYAERSATPWWAAAAFAWGGYAVEYAQGVWPHALALALTTAAAYGAARLRDIRKVKPVVAWAFAAGLAAGLAAGVRYQNILVAGLIGLGVLFWAPLRWRASLAYGFGVLLPVSATAAFNQARYGYWNPISKGPNYLPSVNPLGEGASFWVDLISMAWARIVDYSLRPPLTGTVHSVYLRPDPESGAYLLGSTVKKAWLQSAPWIIIALLVLLVALAPRRSSYSVPWPRRQHRETRALALVVLPVLAMFAASGVARTDGFGFNQRYFLELVPLAAIAFAWALERIPRDTRQRQPRIGPVTVRVLVGFGLGILAALAALILPTPTRYLWILYIPLIIAVLAGLAWAFAVARMRRAPGSTRSLVGIRATVSIALAAAGLGWAGMIHLQDDLQSSRDLRQLNARRAAALEQVLPERSAVFAYWGMKDFVGPVLLDHDLVVFDVRSDRGVAAEESLEAVLDQGRAAFLIGRNFPRDGVRALASGRAARLIEHPDLWILNLQRGAPTAGDAEVVTPEPVPVPEPAVAEDGTVDPEDIEALIDESVERLEVPPPVTDPVPSPP